MSALMIIKRPRNLEKYLVKLAGEDYLAYTECNDLTRRRIRYIGFVVFIIFLVCFLSILEAFSELFHNLYVGLTIGLFFGWVVTNMYLLLLYTLAKNLLVPNHIKSQSSLSYFIRVATVIFFAVVVSQPIEHYFFQKYVLTEVATVKAQKLDDLYQTVNQSYDERLKLATQDSVRDRLRQEKKSVLALNQRLINEANFYTLSLRILSNKLYPWSVTLLLIWLFIYPLYLKRKIEPTSNYYKIKRRRQFKLITNEYDVFKRQYRLILSEYTDENLEYSEFYVDPPFNFSFEKEKLELKKEKVFIEGIHE